MEDCLFYCPYIHQYNFTVSGRQQKLLAAIGNLVNSELFIKASLFSWITWTLVKCQLSRSYSSRKHLQQKIVPELRLSTISQGQCGILYLDYIQQMSSRSFTLNEECVHETAISQTWLILCVNNAGIYFAWSQQNVSLLHILFLNQKLYFFCRSQVAKQG